MPESVNGGNSNPAQPPAKEMSMETRLLLAFILMGAVMFVTPYFFKQPPKPPANPAGNQTTASQTTPNPTSQTGDQPAANVKPAAATAPAAEAASAAPLPGATKAQSVPNLVIETDLFRVVFSNQGANVRSWVLKKYRGNDGKQLDLANGNADAKIDPPLSLSFPAQKPAGDVNRAFYEQTPDADGLGVAFEFSDGHTAVRKTFRFQKSSYLSQITSEVSVDGKPVPAMLTWRGGFGDLTLPSPATEERALYFDVAQNKLVQHPAGDAKNGTLTASGNFSFAGLADKYFAAVFLPGDSTAMQVASFKDTLRLPQEEKDGDYPGLGVADGDINHFEVFVGPKDLNLLKRLNPKLEQVVDFGWFSILAKPLFLLVDWFNGNFIHNFGWAIVIVTVIINFALFPMKLSNMKSMRKMQALKPQIDAINAKYKNVGMRDPKAADKNQEVMDLYKKYGVNPMGGCVPMLLQVPFFIAFYKVFMVSVEMRGAPWLWVSDLSQPEHFVIKILPIAMIASQFIMQKMTPQANADPSQQKMMMFMPLIFGFMFYRFPSGLVLYYLTSNLVNMGQQWFFNHTEAAQEAARSVEPPKKKNGRK
jgi:YidC/Oxa1 family membrane protein insertase